MYDHTKGGVDLLSTNHFLGMKSERWLLNSLAFFLDTVITNSKTILQDDKVSFTNFLFNYELEKALVMPNIWQRYDNPIGIQSTILGKIRLVLGVIAIDRNVLQVENNAETFGRSYKWIELIVGTPNCKESRKNLNNRLKMKCFQCK